MPKIGYKQTKEHRELGGLSRIGKRLGNTNSSCRLEVKEKISKGNSGKVRTQEYKKWLSDKMFHDNPMLLEQNRIKCSEGIKRSYRNGRKQPIRKWSDYSTWYESPYAGRVYLRSSYELIVAKALDRWGISWKHEDVRIQYVGEDGKQHTWIVDFHIVGEFEFCIETKGWVIKNDILKWISFHKQCPDVGLMIVTWRDLWMFEEEK